MRGGYEKPSSDTRKEAETSLQCRMWTCGFWVQEGRVCGHVRKGVLRAEPFGGSPEPRRAGLPLAGWPSLGGLQSGAGRAGGCKM